MDSSTPRLASKYALSLTTIASKLAPTGTTALRLTAGFFVPGFQAKKSQRSGWLELSG